jgi:hypothetical protein
VDSRQPEQQVRFELVAAEGHSRGPLADAENSGRLEGA